MSPRRSGRWLVPAVLAVAMVLPWSGAEASCVPPSLVVPEMVHAPATAIEVRGEGFLDGCEDTSTEGAFGCSPRPKEQANSLQDVELLVRQGGREWPLGTADASADGDIRWRAALPAELRQGTAELVAGPATSEIVLGP